MQKLTNPPTMLNPDIEFRDYQLEGVRTLASKRMILGDQMGLGKTLQALSVAAIDYDKGRRRFLVVATPSLKGNWAEEIEKFTYFSYVVLDGTPKKKERILAEFAAGDTNFLLTNYEQVVRYQEELMAMEFDVVFFDEAHLIKSYRSKRAKACRRVARTIKRRVPITGSPLLNSVEELWSLLNIVSPEDWANYWVFRNRYCHFGGWQGKQVIGVKNEAELHSKLKPFLLRRLKADVSTELPDKLFNRVYVDLSPLQRRLYNEAVKEQQITLPNDPTPMDVENALTRRIRLKQIAGSAGTIEGYEDESEKLDRAVEIASEIINSGEPVVIFTQFRDIQRFLVDRLNAVNIPTWQLNGDVKPSDRVPTVRAWSDAASNGMPGAIVCMYQVAGVGLNMTAANQIILVDKPYVPENVNQAIDRVHRIGVDNTKPVTVHELIARRTIEERIEKILERKTEIFGVVVEGPEFKLKLVMALMEEHADVAA